MYRLKGIMKFFVQYFPDDEFAKVVKDREMEVSLCENEYYKRLKDKYTKFVQFISDCKLNMNFERITYSNISILDELVTKMNNMGKAILKCEKEFVYI